MRRAQYTIDRLKAPLLQYLLDDGIVQSMDLQPRRGGTSCALDSIILQPRGLRYRIMFPDRPGPTPSRRR